MPRKDIYVMTIKELLLEVIRLTPRENILVSPTKREVEKYANSLGIDELRWIEADSKVIYVVDSDSYLHWELHKKVGSKYSGSRQRQGYIKLVKGKVIGVRDSNAKDIHYNIWSKK